MGFLRGYKPIVQVIDNLERVHKLGLVFELKVDSGKLLVCATDLLEMKNQPEARQLLASLLAYAASDQFDPKTAAPAEQLRELFMTTLIISGKVSASSKASGWPARNPEYVLDENDDTQWVAAKDASNAWLRIDFDQPQRLGGAEILWLEDQPGYSYRVEQSADGSHWRTISDQAHNTFAGGRHRLNFDSSDEAAKSVRIAVMGVPPGMQVGVREVHFFSAAPAPSVPPQPSYVWKNAAIYGGGFVSGIVVHPRKRDVIYARTDIGGAYRWDARTKTWIAITDWVGGPDWSDSGIESIAIDPSNPDRVYIATGTYTNDWVHTNGNIFRSDDRGRTWPIKAQLPFKNGANEEGRNAGERLAVDPRDGNIVYFGSRNEGLWRSSDAGTTWHRVESFPIKLRTTAWGLRSSSSMRIRTRTSACRGRSRASIAALTPAKAGRQSKVSPRNCCPTTA